MHFYDCCLHTPQILSYLVKYQLSYVNSLLFLRQGVDYDPRRSLLSWAVIMASRELDVHLISVPFY